MIVKATLRISDAVNGEFGYAIYTRKWWWPFWSDAGIYVWSDNARDACYKALKHLNISTYTLIL